MKKMLVISMVLFFVLSGTVLATDVLAVLLMPSHGPEVDIDYLQCEYTGQPELNVGYVYCTGRAFLYDWTAKSWVFRDIHWGSLDPNNTDYLIYTDFELVNGHKYELMMFIDEVHPDYIPNTMALGTVKVTCTTKGEITEKK